MTFRSFDPVPATVLDPFSGAGTTGLVAKQLGRAYIGLDLKDEYNRIAQRRIEDEPTPLPVVV